MENVVLFALCTCVVMSYPHTTFNREIKRTDTLAEIGTLLKSVETNFTLGESKNVVLVLGTTGVGKSMLTSFITGAELEAIEG